MSWPSSVTVPATRAVGTVSCMRFKHRSSVDLPHPDGPMIAVTSRSPNAMATLRTTSAAPKNALSDDASRRTRAAAAAGCPAGVAAVGRGTRGDSVSTTAESGARREAGCKADDKDDPNEHEGASPGERVLLVVRANGEREDLKREGRDGLAERRRPELIAQHREEQRGGFAGDARHRDERAR